MEIERCPYCGGEAEMQDGSIAVDGWFVCCFECNASSTMVFPGKVTNEEVRAILIAAWNRRYVTDDKNGKAVFAGDEVRCVPLKCSPNLTVPHTGTIAYCDITLAWCLAVGNVKYALRLFKSIELIESEVKDE